MKIKEKDQISSWVIPELDKGDKILEISINVLISSSVIIVDKEGNYVVCWQCQHNDYAVEHYPHEHHRVEAKRWSEFEGCDKYFNTEIVSTGEKIPTNWKRIGEYGNNNNWGEYYISPKKAEHLGLKKELVEIEEKAGLIYLKRKPAGVFNA